MLRCSTILHEIIENGREKKVSSIVTVSRVVIIFGLFVGLFWNSLVTLQRYLDNKTSVSLSVVSEFDGMYPSVTFCPKFRNESNLLDYLEEKQKQGFKQISEFKEEFHNYIDSVIINRFEILEFFGHGQAGGFPNILNDDDAWEAANRSNLPHYVYTGACHTYNPTVISWPGKWFGIRFGITLNLSDSSINMSREEKETYLDSLDIFIHEKDKFVFSFEEDMPDNAKILTSNFAYNKETIIELKWSSFKSLSKPQDDLECIDDEDYNWRDCLLQSRAEVVGCQPPWNYRDWIEQPVCDDLNETIAIFSHNTDATWPFWSKLGRKSETTCPLPCSMGFYSTKYFSRYCPDGREPCNGDWIVTLTFPSYVFEFQEEFEVCDNTCVLAELGGNLGFFLGGSILGLLDIIVMYIMIFWDKITNKHRKNKIRV